MTESNPVILEQVSHIRHFCDQIPDAVRIVAVTKQVPVLAMRSAYLAGLRDFGENRIQETIEKQEALKDLSGLTWHFIGHLQRNKVLKAVQYFDWIQSIDSLALAQRIDRIAQDQAKIIQGCLQVKLRPDDTKSGWLPEDLLRSLPQLAVLRALQIQGLMLIPPAQLSGHELQACFADAAHLAAEIRQQSIPSLPMLQLSMGMSNDYQLALQTGATIIRPGSILFGPRSYI
jgi:PLP dependent protein